MSSEEALWKAMNKAIGKRGHFSRVESHADSPGIPDIDYCIGGIEGHIELKFGRSHLPKIRPSQINWFRNRVKAGGRPWLFTCIIGGSGKYWMLHKGSTVVKYKLWKENDVAIWQTKAIAMWEGKMDWEDLIGFLTINWSK